jgi:hypothetical protein
MAKFTPTGAMPNALSAAAMPWLNKNNIVNDPTRIDISKPNAWQNYGDNSAGSAMIPTFQETNASDQFEITDGHTMVDTALTINQPAVLAAPTAKVNAGATTGTTRVYQVVGRAGNLQCPAASSVSVTTGAATLTAVNSITISWVPLPGYLAYDVYRTTAGGSPPTTGLIGSVAGAFNSPNVSTPALSFTDTGIVADGSTVPSSNTTGAVVGDLNVYGNLNLNALATPAAPVLTILGTGGSTTITYKIVARSGSVLVPTGHTPASAGTQTTGANATLTATNAVYIQWQPVVGAVSYDVYRSATNGTAPTTVGKIGNTTHRYFTDTGLAGDTNTAPTTQTTGVSGIVSSTSPSLAAILDTNAATEITLTATPSAVNSLTLANAATGNPVTLTAVGDSAAGLTINTGPAGALKFENITGGSTTTIAGAVTAGSASDVVNIATGNAASTATKKVNIATGVPNTSGANQVTIGGGATSAVTVNAATSFYQAPNQITAGGAANAITGTLLNAAGVAVTVATGLRVTVWLGSYTLQATGGNTFNLNSGSAIAIKKHTAPTVDQTVAYAANGVIELLYDGTHWLDLSA